MLLRLVVLGLGAAWEGLRWGVCAGRGWFVRLAALWLVLVSSQRRERGRWEAISMRSFY